MWNLCTCSPSMCSLWLMLVRARVMVMVMMSSMPLFQKQSIQIVPQPLALLSTLGAIHLDMFSTSTPTIHPPTAFVMTIPPGTDTTPKSQTWAQPTGWPLSHQCLTTQRSKSLGKSSIYTSVGNHVTGGCALNHGSGKKVHARM